MQRLNLATTRDACAYIRNGWGKDLDMTFIGVSWNIFNKNHLLEDHKPIEMRRLYACFSVVHVYNTYIL